MSLVLGAYVVTTHNPASFHRWAMGSYDANTRDPEEQKFFASFFKALDHE
jgi:hypothetical protein